MKVLISGITGLVDSHLAEHFLNKDGVAVSDLVRWWSRTGNIRYLLLTH